MTRDEFMEFLRDSTRGKIIEQSTWIEEVNSLYDKIESWMGTAIQQELVHITRSKDEYPKLKIETPAQAIMFLPTSEYATDKHIKLTTNGRESALYFSNRGSENPWYTKPKPNVVSCKKTKEHLDESVFYSIMIEALK